MRDRIITLVLACGVAAVALAVHARVLGYPFIQDDWYYIDKVLTTDLHHLLLDEFSPFGKDVYRPLGILYFVLVAKVFDLNPFLAHITALGLHVASSLVVVAVLGRLTGDSVLGWLGGVLYASASFVHMDPLLWASGIFESASVLLALLSLWAFLQGHTGRCAIAYAAALLFKESVAFLPLIFFTIAWFDGIPGHRARVNARWSIRHWTPICLAMVLYGGIKLAGTSVRALPPDHPYALRMTGPHVLRNVLTYWKWSIEALFPSDQPVSAGAARLLAALAAVLGACTLAERQIWRRAIPLIVWLVGSMSIYLFLPNHVYRYYMTVALPPLVGLLLLSVRACCKLIRLPAPTSAVLMAFLAAASVTSSFVYFRQIDGRGLNQPYTEGTNDLVRRGMTVTAVHESLLRAHPTLPPGAVLLFKGVVLWAFGQHAGPRVWYHDSTIRAYDANDLIQESGRWFLRNPLEDQVEAYIGAPPRRIALECCQVFFFELTARGLVERQLESIQHSIDVAGYGLLDAASAKGTYQLEQEQDGQTAVLRRAQGSTIAVVRDSLEGHLDVVAVSENYIDVAGWAADTRSLAAQSILVFVGGKNVLTLPLGAERPDLVKAFGNKELHRAGFRYRIPRPMLIAPSAVPSLRFFAISDDGRVASELKYPVDYPFQRR